MQQHPISCKNAHHSQWAKMHTTKNEITVGRNPTAGKDSIQSPDPAKQFDCCVGTLWCWLWYQIWQNWCPVERERITILWRWRDPTSRMWHPTSCQLQQYSASPNETSHMGAIHQWNCQQHVQLWMHRSLAPLLPCYLFLSKHIYFHAIEWGYLWWCQGLSYQGIKKYISGHEDATVKGHMNQTQQGIQSTKTKPQQ